MFKRFMTLGLAAVLIAGLLFTAMVGTQAAEVEASIHQLLEKYPMENIEYTYIDRGGEGTEERNASVWFSPALLMGDSRSLSPELAKASVALAMAAYDQLEVSYLLEDMGFTPRDNASVYSRSKIGLTLGNCDYVAYTIADKDVVDPVTGQMYTIYCVPIKGTSGNAEWFSNFNIGTGIEHEGFQKASMEVYAELSSHMASDLVDEEHTIVWLTGHSRGAACANLIAGWLSSEDEVFTTAQNVFAYTYACPSVSLEADTTLTNIYNFNNVGDLIPMLPLADWGYKRYGQTITLDHSDLQLSNFRKQFQNENTAAYEGQTTQEHFLALARSIFGTDLEAFNSSGELQTVLDAVAWELGGKNDVAFTEVLAIHMLDVAKMGKDLYDALFSVDGLNAALEYLCSEDAYYIELMDWVNLVHPDTVKMTDDEFQDFLSLNDGRIDELENNADIEITKPDDLLEARDALREEMTAYGNVQDCIYKAIDLMLDADGNPKKAVAHGHTQSTYVIWTNSMYYGYRGWYGTDAVEHLVPDGTIFSIGDECFAGSTSLNTLIVNNPLIYLGNHAFYDCDALQRVTIPVDCDQRPAPFEQASNVQTIHYTYGMTGRMMDRVRDPKEYPYDAAVLDYDDTLEYASRESVQNVLFDYGITNVGAYFFFGSESSSLRTVTLPETLSAIGSFAFYGCSELENITLPEGLESLGSYAFYGCSGLTRLPDIPSAITAIDDGVFGDCDGITELTVPAHVTGIGEMTFWGCDGLISLTIPETVTALGRKAFYGCGGLETLTLPDTPLALGEYAFGDCENLRTVTLPVDYDFSNKPFSGEYDYEYTTGVTTIHYTPGQSGVMPDRSNNEDEANYYAHTLECVSRNSLQSIDCALGITHMGDHLFGHGSTSLQTLKLPASLQSIGCNAFYNCDALTEVVIPAKVTLVSSHAFYDCDTLTELTLPDAAASLGLYAFGSCGDLRTVTLPVDYDFSNDPFGGPTNYDYADGVTTIHYTPGQSGVMTDRSDDANEATYYQKTLEYYSKSCLNSIDFAEGVTHIGNYLFGNGSSLETAQLPSTLKSVGDYAFYNCTELSAADLPMGTETLGNYAFYNCDGLTEVTIPETVTAIGERAFYDCGCMEELTLPDTPVSLGMHAFASCDGLRTVTLPVDYDISNDPFYGTYDYYGTTGVTTIHFTPGQTGIMPDRSDDGTQKNFYQFSLEHASRGSIQSMDFAEGITHIGAYLVGNGAYALTEVKLPSTLKTIGNYAFNNCTELPAIDFPMGTETLGDYAFYNCDGLKAVTIPETVTAIGERAFYDCGCMEELTLPDTPVSLGKHAFASCDGLRTVTLPVDYDISNDPFYGTYDYYGTTGVTTIHFTPGQTGILPDRSDDSTQKNYYQFSLEHASRNSIKTIDFKEGITHIGNYLFGNGANALTEVKLPSTLKTIGDYAFYNCTALPDIHLPEGLESIGSHGFYSCDSFTAIPKLPVGLSVISDYAFYDCDGLEAVTIPETVTAIGECAFYDCSGMEKLTLPDTPVSLGKYAFANCDGLRTVTLPVDYDISNDPFYGTYDYYGTTGVTTIHFTPGQTGIMPDRSDDSTQKNFYQFSLEYASRGSIQSMDFAEGITHIGAYLFGNGAYTLTEVKLPSTLKTIGDSAFNNCTKLSAIDFPMGMEILGDYVFYNCDGLKAVTIPETVTAIGERAFYDCGCMEELTLPDTPVSLGKHAFASCDGLRTVTLPVDYDISNDPFYGTYDYYGTTGVTTIHFTPGQTGILPDRSDDGSQKNYYQFSLEYASRGSIQTVDFEDGITYIGSYALHNLLALPTITFQGNAPEIASDAFRNTTATCRYPGWDETWTADVMLDYGGTLTWVAYGCDPITLTGKSFTLSFEDEILVNFYYTLSDLTNVAEHGMLVFCADPGAVDFAAADAVYSAPVYDSANDRYMATTTGIAPKEMGDTRYYCAYAKLADGTYVYSSMYDYSPKKYAMNMLGKTTTSDKQKALCVAMLNYGAAAQSYFNYRTDALMNAELTAEHKALVTGYDKTLFTGAVTADTNKIGTFATTASGFSKKSATVSFEGAFSVNYYFTPNAAVSGDMTLYIWTPEAYAAADTLTAENATIMTMVAGPDGRYWGQVSGISAKALDDTYYVSGVYTDAEGNTHCTGVIAYSLSKYCMNNANGNMGELAQATAMYGYYAKNYFA